jgi:hypothetical protein
VSDTGAISSAISLHRYIEEAVVAEELPDAPKNPAATQGPAASGDPADPAGTSDPARAASAESPETLLLRALDSLSDAQRRDVLRWLFERIPQAAHPLRGLAAGPLGPEGELTATLSAAHGTPRTGTEVDAVRQSLLFGMSDPLRGDYQMVPVRLPTADHVRLRAWSQEHGFAMATIIRGLLARFLDEQHPGSPEAGTATAG